MSTPRSSRALDQQKRPTDQQIQERVIRQSGFRPETAWIAHCRWMFGIIPPEGTPEWHPGDPECPNEKITAIMQSLRSLGVMF